MIPQLASEPFGNVWLLREALDGAGQGRASPVLPQELSTAFRSGVVVSRWGQAVPWGPCPFVADAAPGSVPHIKKSLGQHSSNPSSPKCCA